MAEHDSQAEFLKTAILRLRDAQELLELPSLRSGMSDASSRHLGGAVYLAGYTIECILKAYITGRVRYATTLTQAVDIRRGSGEDIPDLQGLAGHNLALLMSLTDLEKSMTVAHKKRLGLCLRWRSVLRYDPRQPSRDFAEQFVQAIGYIYRWIRMRV